MASKDRERTRVGSLTYFYWEGVLHKKLILSKTRNIVYAKNMDTEEEVSISYVDWKRYSQKSFTTTEAAWLVGRHPKRVFHYIRCGLIKAPRRLTPPKREGKAGYFWSEDDVLRLRDLLVDMADRARNRKESEVSSVISEGELKNKMGRGEVLYVRTKDGRFVPTWEA